MIYIIYLMNNFYNNNKKYLNNLKDYLIYINICNGLFNYYNYNLMIELLHYQLLILIKKYKFLVQILYISYIYNKLPKKIILLLKYYYYINKQHKDFIINLLIYIILIHLFMNIRNIKLIYINQIKIKLKISLLLYIVNDVN